MREFIIRMVPNLADSFSLVILVANLAAALVLCLATALHRRKVLYEDVNMMVGIIGAMSTLSSFAYGSVVLISASKATALVSLVYVVVTLVLGCIAIIVGEQLDGRTEPPRAGGRLEPRLMAS
jgi:CrcB protein